MGVATQFGAAFAADPVHSSVAFAVRHMGLSDFRGSFRGVRARLTATDAGLSLEGAVRVESISIDDPPEFRAHVVRGGDFFEADRHAELSFVSDEVKLGPDARVEVVGALTMKGVTRRVVASGTYSPPVDDPFGARRAALELRAVVDRREWGLDWQRPLPSGGDALGWTVEVTAHLELVEVVGIESAEAS
jgi:polyisoprenoid-binding protein YceI